MFNQLGAMFNELIRYEFDVEISLVPTATEARAGCPLLEEFKHHITLFTAMGPESKKSKVKDPLVPISTSVTIRDQAPKLHTMICNGETYNLQLSRLDQTEKK